MRCVERVPRALTVPPRHTPAAGESPHGRHRYSLRGQFLIDVEDVLGAELFARVRVSSFEHETPESHAHVRFAAARWCLYWVQRGHGLMPWL